MPLDHLWSTWRSDYVTGGAAGAEAVQIGEAEAARFATADAEPPREDGDTRSLFERILAWDAPDSVTGIVWRGEHCFVLLNRFPYTSGHAMVLPNRAVSQLEDLTDPEHAELWDLVRHTVEALKRALNPDGINVGVNLGRAAGGSQSDHLHVHCVPRWVGDANFMTTVAETRTLPISTAAAHAALTAAWDPPTV